MTDRLIDSYMKKTILTSRGTALRLTAVKELAKCPAKRAFGGLPICSLSLNLVVIASAMKFQDAEIVFKNAK